MTVEVAGHADLHPVDALLELDVLDFFLGSGLAVALQDTDHIGPVPTRSYIVEDLRGMAVLLDDPWLRVFLHEIYRVIERREVLALDHLHTAAPQDFLPIGAVVFAAVAGLAAAHHAIPLLTELVLGPAVAGAIAAEKSSETSKIRIVEIIQTPPDLRLTAYNSTFEVFCQG